MEAAQKRGLARLMLRWPEYRPNLRQRVKEDPYLLELVGAYETAFEAVIYWTYATEAMAGERAEEYRQLLVATEEDILAQLV